MSQVLQFILNGYVIFFLLIAAYSQALRWWGSVVRLPVGNSPEGARTQRTGQIDSFYKEESDDWVPKYLERKKRWMRVYGFGPSDEVDWEVSVYSAAHRKAYFN